MSISPGTSLGSFKIVSLLGVGGMGEVYRARDSKLGREVAIKVLPEAFAKDKDRLARFEREAKLLASLNHPNIASIYGLDEADGMQFLEMELIEGSTLDDRIALGAMRIEDALPLFSQIAEAIEFAHENGVIHRDLKPANIKVTEDGTVKVLDFGLAKALEDAPSSPGAGGTLALDSDSAGKTGEGQILGTPAYMSPRQARGQQVDKRADIWAFGCCLYEALAGKRPFHGETATDLLAEIVKGEPDWEKLPPNVPARVRLLIWRCLQKDPKRRLRDIGEARFELSESGSDASGVVPVLGATVAAPKPNWIAYALTAALAVGVGWLLSSTLAPEASPSEATAQSSAGLSRVHRATIPLPPGTEFSYGDADYIWTRSNDTPRLAISPDGSTLIFGAREGKGVMLYQRRFEEDTAHVIPGTENAMFPYFSPDGKSIAFGTTRGSLKTVALKSGRVSKLTSVSTPWVGRWSTDGHIYYRDNTGLRKIPSGGGKFVQLPRPDVVGFINLFDIFPGGEWGLASIYRGGSVRTSGIWAIKFETGESRQLISEGSQPAYLPTGHLVYFRGSEILAAPFDLEKLEVTGDAAVVVDDVLVDWAYEVPYANFSDAGILVYASGPSLQGRFSLVWVDRQGQIEPISGANGNYAHLRLSPDGTKIAYSTRTEWDIWVWDLSRRGARKIEANPGYDISPMWVDNKRVGFVS